VEQHQQPMNLTTRDILLITFRSYFIRLFYNYRFLFGHGLCFCLLPYGKKSNLSTVKMREFTQRHICFFNANEYVVGFAIGFFLKLENEENYDKINNVKKIFSSTLGALGDNLVYKLIVPVLVLILANMFIFFQFQFNNIILITAVILLLMFNIFNFAIRYYGIRNGFRHGLQSLRFTKRKFFITLEKGLAAFKIALLGITAVNLLQLINVSEQHNMLYFIPAFILFIGISIKKNCKYRLFTAGIFIAFFLLTIYCFLPKQ